MKKIAIFIIFSIFVFGCSNSKKDGIDADIINNPATADGIDASKADKLPVITFEKVLHDFGYVTKGERLSYSFKFKNSGKSNLVISYVESSCGCTTSSPPKAPIKPGESGEIKVTFDSKTKTGFTSSQVLVTANTYPVKTLLTVNADVK
jgi:hypothetical protein